MTRVLTALVALLLLATPAAATAQEPLTNAPPGNSAIDEYLETVPGSSGSQRPAAARSGGGGAVLTPAERARLERLGPDGEALADAVEATAPPAAARPRDGRSTSTAQRAARRSARARRRDRAGR